jgi:hypothetical protein
LVTWREFETQSPELAAFGAARLTEGPCYLATVRDSGMPRVHPVTPILGDGRLFVFMEPTSPKGRDLRERGRYALHNGVPDSFGSGGEFWISGRAVVLEEASDRVAAVAASNYQPEDRYILFEFGVEEARCNGYGDVPLPSPTAWRASPRASAR